MGETFTVRLYNKPVSHLSTLLPAEGAAFVWECMSKSGRKVWKTLGKTFEKRRQEHAVMSPGPLMFQMFQPHYFRGGMVWRDAPGLRRHKEYQDGFLTTSGELPLQSAAALQTNNNTLCLESFMALTLML